MYKTVFLFLSICFCVVLALDYIDDSTEVAQNQWDLYPSRWAMENRIPMTTEYDMARKSKFRVKKKFRRFLLPLLLAYKLKFFTLIPVLIGGLVLLTGTTGLAGFFFALFAAVMGLKAGGH